MTYRTCPTAKRREAGPTGAAGRPHPVGRPIQSPLLRELPRVRRRAPAPHRSREPGAQRASRARCALRAQLARPQRQDVHERRRAAERVCYAEAVRHGVSFTPGGAITAERRQHTSLRLSFSLVEPGRLDEGIRRLARALREVRRRDRTAFAAPLS